MDKGGTWTNGQKDKKIDDEVEDFTFKRLHMCQETKEKKVSQLLRMP